MRIVTLATAALAALTIASAPAAAQGRAEAIQRLCPDLTFNQIGNELAQLVEQYEFSADQDEAAMQAASLLCGYGGDSAEVEEEKPGATQAVLPPPQGPYFNRNLPHFNGPKPRFARPMHKHHPHARPHYPRPHYGQRPRMPRYGYKPPPRGHGYRPPTAGGYPQGYSRQGGYGYGGSQYSEHRSVGSARISGTGVKERPLPGPIETQYRCWGETGEDSGGPGTGNAWCRNK